MNPPFTFERYIYKEGIASISNGKKIFGDIDHWPAPRKIPTLMEPMREMKAKLTSKCWRSSTMYTPNEVAIPKAMNWIQKAEAMITSPHGFSTSKQAIFYKRSGIGETLETNTDWCIKKTHVHTKVYKNVPLISRFQWGLFDRDWGNPEPVFYQTARKWSSNNNKLRMNKKYLLSQLGTKRSMLN